MPWSRSRDKLPARCTDDLHILLQCVSHTLLQLLNVGDGCYWARSLTFELPKQYDCTLQCWSHQSQRVGGWWSRHELFRGSVTWEWNSTGLLSRPVLSSGMAILMWFTFLGKIELKVRPSEFAVDFKQCPRYLASEAPGALSFWSEMDFVPRMKTTQSLIYQEVYAVIWEILTDKEGKRTRQLDMPAHLEDIQRENIFLTVWNFTY